MKCTRAVGVIGAAGLGSVAQAIAICDCSVLGCRTDAVAQEEVHASVLLDDTVLNELAHEVSDIYADLNLVFNLHSEPAILQDSCCLLFSEEILQGVDVGFDFYCAFATRSTLRSPPMEVVFDSMGDVIALQEYLAPKYVRGASMGRGIDLQFYTAANMIAWAVAVLSTSVRLPE